MGGAIGLTSNVNIGAEFWFMIPVKLFSSDEATNVRIILPIIPPETHESQQYAIDIETTQKALLKDHSMHVLVISTSQITLALLKTMLEGFDVALSQTLQYAETYLRNYPSDSPLLDFVVLDDQSEVHAEELSRLLPALNNSSLRNTKIIHLYTPTTNLSSHAMFGSNTPGVLKITKPPRRARLLQTLATCKNLPNMMTSIPAGQVTKTLEDLASVQRTLFGNVLVAEGSGHPHLDM